VEYGVKELKERIAEKEKQLHEMRHGTISYAPWEVEKMAQSLKKFERRLTAAQNKKTPEKTETP
jgi:hypothetical protein